MKFGRIVPPLKLNRLSIRISDMTSCFQDCGRDVGYFREKPIARRVWRHWLCMRYSTWSIIPYL